MISSTKLFNRFTESGIELVSCTIQQDFIHLTCFDYDHKYDIWNYPKIECTLENVSTSYYDYETPFDLDFGQLKLFGIYINTFSIDQRCRQVGPDEFEYYFVTVAQCTVSNYEIQYADSEYDKLTKLEQIVQQLRESR